MTDSSIKIQTSETLSNVGLYDAIPEYNSKVYDIIRTYFDGHHTERLVRHQIESFNDFVHIQIHKTVQMFNPIRIHSENDFIADKGQYYLEIEVQFDNLRFHPAMIYENNGSTKKMFPQEAKLRNITYASNMTVDMNIQYIIRNTENMDEPKYIPKKMPSISIGKMPIMLKSDICALKTHSYPLSLQNTEECEMDCGGYFILKGSEKTVLGQERTAENKIYCFDEKNTSKWSWIAEMKSVPDYKCISPKQIEMMISNKTGALYIQIPRIKIPIELFTLYRALGVESDKKICEYICFDVEHLKNKEVMEFLVPSIMESNKYMTKESALNHIVSHVAYTPMNTDRDNVLNKKREFTLEVLRTDLMPHCTSVPQKLYLLGMMASKLIRTSFGWLPQDDRDSYLNKRIELTGTLLNNLFRNYYNKLLKEMQKLILREINTSSWRSTHDYENIINMTNIYKLIKPATIENGINRALSTGDFSIKQMNSSKVGVAQVLNRLTYPATLSHMRRINTPIEKSGELIPPRKLHTTTWGYLCLAGDTDILMANQIDSKLLRDIRDGDNVNTVDRETLLQEPSRMHHFFCKMPDRLFEITTISGRKIKATAEHPFLVKNIVGDYEMKKVEEIQWSDKVIIRPMVRAIPSTTSTDEAKEKARIYGQIKQNKRVPRIPLWIQQGDKALQREYLSALHSNPFQYLESPNKGTFENKIVYMQQLQKMYQGFEIDCRVHILYDTKSVYLYFDSSVDNQIRFADTFHNYSLSHNSFTIEKLRIRQRNGTKVGQDCESLEYGFLAVPLESIQEIPPEPVYDFTTESKNHSFIASSFVSSNCSIESPEGQSVGVVKNIAYMAHITIPCNSSALYDYVKPFIKPLEEITETKTQVFEKVKVLVNGCWVGVTDTPIELLKDLRQKKYTGVINVYTSIIFDYPLAEIRICADGGRLTRPVLRIKDNNQLVLNSELLQRISEKEFEWNDLMIGGIRLDESVIEYIDPDEQNFALIAMNTKKGDTMNWRSKQYTHAEIHPSTCMGILASCIPFPEHNQAPRNTYQCLDVKELVWMADGKRKQIQHVCVGDRVLTFHPETFAISETRVVNQFVRPNEFPIYKIQTIKGETMKERVISATEDHRFMTQFGWKTVKQIMENSKIQIGILNENKKVLFVPIKCITREPDGLISCIETESENHSFIAGTGGFLSSNCAMQKQAMGIYATNYDKRMDKTGYILTYPMRPLVDTRLMNFININKVPSGCQIFVAIMTHTGYNQEDSVLINKGAIDRGLFVTTIYHTEKDEDKNVVRDEIIRCKPDKTKTRGMKFGNYEKLNSKGFIPEHTLVENRDVIIAKVTPIKENRNDPSKIIKYEDQSKVFRTMEETYIDKNYTGRNGDGYNFAKTRTRIFRKPVIGDKFASRSSQKGTLGNIIAEEDMPFTKNGLRPDLILNPHAIPSRMTIAQLKETLLGKVLLELGMFGDGTAFSDLSIQTIMEELQKLGFESCGNEIMYSGETGKQLETSVFVGPVFYQRLKHMVNDKQHSRAIGPMVNLTRQPAEGRCRDGGFRIGEMERDVMIGHGISEFCKERLMDASDKYGMYVCRKCGLTASYNDGLRKTDCLKGFQTHLCTTCDNRTEFARVEIPYTYKLLMQELQTVNIATRFITE